MVHQYAHARIMGSYCRGILMLNRIADAQRQRWRAYEIDGEGQATLQGNRRTGSGPKVCSVGTKYARLELFFMVRFDEWPGGPSAPKTTRRPPARQRRMHSSATRVLPALVGSETTRSSD